MYPIKVNGIMINFDPKTYDFAYCKTIDANIQGRFEEERKPSIFITFKSGTDLVENFRITFDNVDERDSEFNKLNQMLTEWRDNK